MKGKRRPVKCEADHRDGGVCGASHFPDNPCPNRHQHADLTLASGDTFTITVGTRPLDALMDARRRHPAGRAIRGARTTSTGTVLRSV